MKGTTREGEMVQVKGGHILRSSGGRKDKHSKVYTSKGPRDRRVRLSAHTAIQFYDVQDRLGYDRPSKAIDWLIKKAKDAIDKLNSNHGSTVCSNPSSNDHQSGNPSGFQLTPGDVSNPMISSLNSFPGFVNEGLGLSLHVDNGNSGNLFQECFLGWSGGDFRVGFGANSQQAMFSQALPFSHREPLQSNFGDQSWNRQASDLESHFEFGYAINPGRVFGEDEPGSHV